jgi:hypothetical protein
MLKYTSRELKKLELTNFAEISSSGRDFAILENV